MCLLRDASFYTKCEEYDQQFENDITCTYQDFNKNGERCRDVKSQKPCEQGWEVNVGTKVIQTTSI